MPLVAQLALTAVALVLFWLVVWRRLSWSAERVVARGTILYDRGDFAGALRLYRTARDRAPKNALPWECEGLACVMLEEYDDAAQALGHAIRLSPKPMRQAHAYLALAMAREGHAARARELLAELTAAIDGPRARLDAGILASAAQAAGGEDLACEVMTALLARHPAEAAARLARAQAEWGRGRPRAARADAAAARDAQPSAARRLEALALLELGQPAEAKRVAKDVAESLGPALRARLARDAAAARAVDPHDVEEAIQRAWTLAESGDEPAAVAALDEAIALEAEPGRERLLRAVRAAIAGEPDPLDPRTACEWRLAARAAESAGRADLAAERHRKADEIDPV